MFFFIDWKLPPPACPGTTGTLYTFSGKIESKRLSQYESMRFLNVSELFHPVCFPARFLQKRINPYRSITFHHRQSLD